MPTDFKALSPKTLTTLPGVQAVDVVLDSLVVLFNDDTSIAITSAPIAELAGLEKWSAYRAGNDQLPSLTTTEVLDLIARMASANNSKC